MADPFLISVLILCTDMWPVLACSTLNSASDIGRVTKLWAVLAPSTLLPTSMK